MDEMTDVAKELCCISTVAYTNRSPDCVMLGGHLLVMYLILGFLAIGKSFLK